MVPDVKESLEDVKESLESEADQIPEAHERFSKKRTKLNCQLPGPNSRWRSEGSSVVPDGHIGGVGKGSGRHPGIWHRNYRDLRAVCAASFGRLRFKRSWQPWQTCSKCSGRPVGRVTSLKKKGDVWQLDGFGKIFLYIKWNCWRGANFLLPTQEVRQAAVEALVTLCAERFWSSKLRREREKHDQNESKPENHRKPWLKIMLAFHSNVTLCFISYLVEKFLIQGLTWKFSNRQLSRFVKKVFATTWNLCTVGATIAMWVAGHSIVHEVESWQLRRFSMKPPSWPVMINIYSVDSSSKLYGLLRIRSVRHLDSWVISFLHLAMVQSAECQKRCVQCYWQA